MLQFYTASLFALNAFTNQFFSIIFFLPANAFALQRLFSVVDIHQLLKLLFVLLYFYLKEENIFFCFVFIMKVLIHFADTIK